MATPEGASPGRTSSAEEVLPIPTLPAKEPSLVVTPPPRTPTPTTVFGSPSSSEIPSPDYYPPMGAPSPTPSSPARTLTADKVTPAPSETRSKTSSASPTTVFADSDFSDFSSDTSTTYRSHRRILEGIHHPKPKRKFSTTSKLFAHPLAKSPSRDQSNCGSSIRTQASSSSHEGLDGLALEAITRLRTILARRTRELERKDKDIAELMGELMAEQYRFLSLGEAHGKDLQEKFTLLRKLEKAYRELKSEKVLKIRKLEVWKSERIQTAVRDPRGGKWSNERGEVEVGGSETCQDWETASFNLEARVWASEAQLQRQDEEIEILEEELELDKASGGKKRGCRFDW